MPPMLEWPCPARRRSRPAVRKPAILRLFSAVLAVALLLAGSTVVSAQPIPTPASQEDEAEFARRAERLGSLLQRRPRRGTAFDLWYRHYLEAGRLESLEQQLRKRTVDRPQEPGGHLLLGLFCERRGQDDQALDAYKTAAKLAPENYYAHAVRGQLHARRFEFEQALPSLRRAVELDPPRAELLELYKQLGRIYLRRGEADRAVDTWQALRKAFPRDVRVLEELAELLAQEGEHRDAIARWREIHELSGDDPFRQTQALLEIGQLQVQRGDRDPGIATLERARKTVKPDSWLGREVQSRIQAAFLEFGDLPGWVRYNQQRLAQRPEDLQRMLQLAAAHGLAGQSEPAIEQYRAALQRAPTRGDVRQALIEQLVRGGKLADALEQARELARRQPNDVEVGFQLGQLHLDTGKPNRDAAVDAALKTWTALADLRPRDPALALRVAETCWRVVRVEQLRVEASSSKRAPGAADDPPDDNPLVATALKFYRLAAERAQGDPAYIEYWGEALHELGRGPEARRVWARMAQEPVATAQSCHRLAEVLKRVKDFPAAADAARKAVQKDGQVYRYRETLLLLALQNQQYSAALEQLPHLQELSDTDALQTRSLQHFVQTLSRAGELDKRIVQLRTRLQGAERSVWDARLLARLLSERSRPANAEAVLRNALSDHPEQVGLREQLVDLLDGQGNQAAAVQELERLAKRDRPRRAVHYERIVSLYLQQGKLSAAGRAAESLLAISPSSVQGYRLQALVALRAKNPGVAIAALRRAVVVAPRDVELRLQLARQLASRDQTAEALEQLWRCFELTNRPRDQQTLAGTIADLALKVDRLDRALNRLEISRRQAQDPRPLTMCLVVMLQRADRLDQAVRELKQLLARYPRDTETLGFLALLSQRRENWAQAVLYQQQLADLTGNPAHLKQLANLLERQGAHEHAERVWQQVIARARDDDAVAAAVDTHLKAGRFQEGKQLSEWGLRKYPDSWRLLYRAALANQYVNRIADAQRHLKRLRDLPVPTATTAAPQVGAVAGPPEVTRLQRALKVMNQFANPGVFPARIRPRGRRVRGPAVQLLLPQEAIVARDDASVASFALATRQTRTRSWWEQAQQAGQRDPATLRSAALACATVARLHVPSEALLVQYQAAFPDDPLPHVVRLIQPPAPEGSSISAEARLMAQSFHWLAERRPDLRQTLLPRYLTELASLRNEELFEQAVDLELRRVERLQELGSLGLLICQWDRRQLVQRLLDQTNQLVATQPRPLPLADLEAILYYLLARDFRDFSDEPMAGRLIDLAQAYVVAEQPPNRPVLGAAPTTRDLSDALKRIEATWTRHVNSASLLRGASPIQIALGSSNNSFSQVLRRQQTMLKHYLRLAGAGTDQVTLFPGPSAFLPPERLVFLQLLHTRLKLAGQLSLLEERLEQATQEANGEIRRRLQMARVSLAWWSYEKADAISILRQACDEGPDDFRLRFTLARAHFLKNNYLRARALVGEVLANADSLAKPAGELARAIEARSSLSALESNLQVHEHMVHCVAVSPDGRWLASGSYDRTIMIWEMATGRRHLRLRGHEDAVMSLAFSPDGKRLGSGSYDGTARLWSVSAGELLHELKHGAVVRAVAFGPGGQQIASGGEDKLVKVWNADAGTLDHTWSGHREMVLGLAFLPDGKSLVSGGADSRVRIWDLASGESTAMVTGLNSPVFALAVSADGRWLATGSDDDLVKVWNLRDRKYLTSLSGHKGTIQGLAFHPDGKHLASAGKDRKVFIWRVLAKAAPVEAFRGHIADVTSVQFAPSGSRLVSGSRDKTVKIWTSRLYTPRPPVPDAQPPGPQTRPPVRRR